MRALNGLAILVFIVLMMANYTFADGQWESVTHGLTINMIDVFFLDPDNVWGICAYNNDWSINNIIKSSDGGRTWSKILNTSNSRLSDIFFLDPHNGWVVGQDGLILHTDDGGESWSKQNANVGNYLISVFFCDADNGWITGAEIILHTGDGGATWVKQYGNKSASLVYVYFADELEGWALGNGGPQNGFIILHTADGGNTWDMQKGGIECLLRCMDFASREVGWASGCSGVILRTDDGGETWVSQNVSNNLHFVSVQCISDNEAWITGAEEGDVKFEYSPVILHTKDAGKTWNRVNMEFEGGGTFHIRFFNAKEGFAVTKLCGMYHTTDGGMSWEVIHPPSEIPSYMDMRRVYFPNENDGWVVADQSQNQVWGALILHASDGGKTLEQQNATDSHYFNGISFINENEGWVVGSYRNVMKGIVLHTQNGGAEWKRLMTTEEWIQDVHFINSSEGCIATHFQILYTSNGGKTWKTVSPQGLSKCWRNFDFVNSQHGWAVYCYGQIAYTEDGGKHWGIIDNSTKPLQRIDFANEKEGWGVGRETVWGEQGEDFIRFDSYIFHTENGGRNWTEAYKVNNCILSDLCFVSNREGWVIGTLSGMSGKSIGIILHTTNGGHTWTEQHRVENKALMSICYDGNCTLYVVGHNNCFLRYTDPLLRSIHAVEPSDKLVVTWGKVRNQLYQNYPNPFNPETWIAYQLAEDNEATISIYSTSGQLVRKLNLGSKKAGNHEAKWDGRDDEGHTVASGIYFYTLNAGEDYTSTKKMVMVR